MNFKWYFAATAFAASKAWLFQPKSVGSSGSMIASDLTSAADAPPAPRTPAVSASATRAPAQTLSRRPAIAISELITDADAVFARRKPVLSRLAAVLVREPVADLGTVREIRDAQGEVELAVREGVVEEQVYHHVARRRVVVRVAEHRIGVLVAVHELVA